MYTRKTAQRSKSCLEIRTSSPQEKPAGALNQYLTHFYRCLANETY